MKPRELTAYDTVDSVVIICTHGDSRPALIEADAGEPSGLTLQGLIEHLAETGKITEHDRAAMCDGGDEECSIRTIRGPFKHLASTS